MPCSMNDLRETARAVQDYWGSHLYVRVVPDGAPSMDWQEVSIPASFSRWEIPELWQTLLHEWGHRTISPVSPRRGALWIRIAQREGLSREQAAVVANIAADAWVDRAYLESRDWAQVYAEGMRAELRGDAARLSLPHDAGAPLPHLRFARLFGAHYRRLVQRFAADSGGLASVSRLEEPQVGAAADAMGRILFDGAAAPEERVLNLARLLKIWVPPDPPVLPLLRLVIAGDQVRRPGERRGPSDLDVLALAVRAGLAERDLEGIFCAEELAGLRLQAQRLRLYAQAVPVVKSCLRQRARMAFTGYRTWTAGRPVRELDVVATLERAHTLIPGVNTLARRYERRGTRTERGAGAVVLVVDDSGSTEGAVLEREKEAAFSVVATARLLGDEVACVGFGSSVTLSLPFTTHYQRIEEGLCGLSSSSGGTCLAPALEEGLRLVGQRERFAVLLMTDAEIADPREVEALVRNLPRFAQIVAFCFAAHSSVRSDLQAALRPPHRVLTASPNFPFAESVLKELYV